MSSVTHLCKYDENMYVCPREDPMHFWVTKFGWVGNSVQDVPDFN